MMAEGEEDLQRLFDVPHFDLHGFRTLAVSTRCDKVVTSCLQRPLKQKRPHNPGYLVPVDFEPDILHRFWHSDGYLQRLQCPVAIGINHEASVISGFEYRNGIVFRDRGFRRRGTIRGVFSRWQLA